MSLDAYRCDTGEGCAWFALTDSNNGSKLGLFVLVGGVDSDGAEEDKSENGEEHERHGAEEVSTLPPRRTTSGTRDHDEERWEKYGADVLAVRDFISGRWGRQVRGTTYSGTDRC
jgi:hypothetical protein